MAKTQKYIVTKKFYRSAHNQGGGRELIKFNVGDSIVPTPAELRDFPDRIKAVAGEEIEIETGAGAVVTDRKPPLAGSGASQAESLVDKAKRELEITDGTRIKAIIRDADPNYLAVLESAEMEHKPKPRVKILEAIERRKKALLSQGAE